MKLRLGISTCPNDTFAFHGLLTGRVPLEGLELDFVLKDVEELNQALENGELHASKASFHRALTLTEEFGVLRSGSAIGFGVGPLLLANEPTDAIEAGKRVLCPGAGTTATLLLRCLHPHASPVDHVLFSDIMPALREGRASYGVVIHEGRFTYRESGLFLVEDLGDRWERETDSPLPLGGILVRHDLGVSVHEQLHRALGASIAYARTNPEEALVTMKRYAAELDDDVIQSHVDLYVNDETVAISQQGEKALTCLEEKAKAIGLVPRDAAPLGILG